MLGSIPEQTTAYAVPAGPFATTAPAALRSSTLEPCPAPQHRVSTPSSSSDLRSSCAARSSISSTADSGGLVRCSFIPCGSSTPTAAATTAAGARRSSVSAYLKGQQDLLTTITAGVPYLSEPPSIPQGVNNTAWNSSSNRCSYTAPEAFAQGSLAARELGAEAAAAAAASGSNSRHTAVKEALSARLSSAGEWLQVCLEV